ncbi:MAG: dTMP kinase [Actinomycetota bacterium]
MGTRPPQRSEREYVAPSERPSGLLSLLKRRYFRRMWAVTTVSSLGDWLGVFALVQYVSQPHQVAGAKAEFAVGGVLLFRVVPGLFFGPFAGVLADRFDRRRLMVAADMARALLIASIPWVHSLWQLYLVSAAMEMLGQMWMPSKDATIPNLVERDQLMMANQLSQISTYASFPFAGALIALLTIPAHFLGHVLPSFANPVKLAFFVDAGTFLFSASRVATFPHELMQAKRARAPGAAWNPFQDLLEGLRFIRSQQMVRTLVLGAWIAFSGGSAIISLGPIFARKLARSVQGQNAAWGTLIVAVGLGLVSGMMSAGWLSRRISRERLFPIGLMVGGVSAVGVSLMTSIQPALPITFAAGFGAGTAWVTTYTLLQAMTEDRLRGRTFATLQTGIQLSLFIGLAGWPLIAGAIGDHTLTTSRYVIDLSGARIAMFAGGVFLFFSGISAARGIATARGIRKTARKRGLRFTAPVLSGGARKGLFISFEGVEGAGKSTQLKLLYEWLRQQGREVIVTREPGGAPIAERIRHILLDTANKGMDSKTEALLYAAGRAQHVAETIRPALERDAVVLCDRYIDSSLAYQGLARGLGEDDVLHLNEWATDELLPDLVILLHLDAEHGLARLEGDPDRMESEDVSFHRKVGEAYLHLAREYPSRFAVVDASGTKEQVHAQVRTAVLPFMANERVAE